MRPQFLVIAILSMLSTTIFAADPSSYSWTDLAGSALPYPLDREPAMYPDSLEVVMVNHVGRHGARYPTSPIAAEAVRKLLVDAYDAGTLTEPGRRLMVVADSVLESGAGRWGRLDSLGVAEQREIAARMFVSFPRLFGSGAMVEAVASRKPRCVMSMFSFLHQLTLLNQGGLDIRASSGTARSDTLLRFFDTDKLYRELALSDTLDNIVSEFEHATIPDAMADRVLRRLVGTSVPQKAEDRLKTASAVYSLVAGCAAMEIDIDPADWMTHDEYERFWAVKNLKQYLYYSANTVSALPAAQAAPLLEELIRSTDGFLHGDGSASVKVRFGHAETLMPLLSLMRVEGAYYLTRQMETVDNRWRDFDLVPMAANIWLTILRGPSGKYYARLDLNERPVPIIPRSGMIYTPWDEARLYLVQCLPAWR